MFTWLSAFLLGFSVHAQSSERATFDAYFKGFQSSFLEIIDKDSPYFQEPLSPYPLWAKPVQWEFIKWSPTGELGFYPEGCHPDDLRAANAEQIREYLQRCHNSVERDWVDPFSQNLSSMWLRYRPFDNPYIRHVIFHLPGGVKLKGLLALKGDLAKRPLVVFRAGIFSNTQEFYAERGFFIQFFEQSPFNLLLLESMSGSEYVKHNTQLAMGGFEEGAQNYFILRQLSKPEEPLNKVISSKHMLALSMGGNGAFFANLLDHVNKTNLISSLVAYCPLVNFQDTFDFHSGQGFSLAMMNYYGARRIKEVGERIPDIRKQWFVTDLMKHIETQYTGPQLGTVDFRWPNYVQEELQKKNISQPLFWRLTSFWKEYRDIPIPTWIFATENDPIVPYMLNAHRLKDGRMNVGRSPVEVIELPVGVHCSLPGAYDWAMQTTMGQDLIYQTMSNKLKTKEIRFPTVVQDKKYQHLKITADAANGALVIRVSYYDQPRPNFWQRLWPSSQILVLGMHELEYQVPRGKVDTETALMLERWAAQNIRSHVEGNELVLTWQSLKED